MHNIARRARHKTIATTSPGFSVPRLLYALECLDHVEALLLGVDGLAVLQFEDGLVRTDAHIEVAVGGGLLEKRDMPRMEHIITT